MVIFKFKKVSLLNSDINSLDDQYRNVATKLGYKESLLSEFNSDIQGKYSYAHTFTWLEFSLT